MAGEEGKKLDDRIRDALADGPMEQYDLAREVWPPDDYPRAWRGAISGGPPGLVLPLGRAIKRMGLVTWFQDRRKIVALPRG